jgi:hypothetical protein
MRSAISGGVSNFSQLDKNVDTMVMSIDTIKSIDLKNS